MYLVAILDFIFDEDQNDPINYRYVVKLTDIEDQNIFYDKLTFVYLEMPKFSKKGKELVTHFDKWMYTLKWLSSLVEPPVFSEEVIFKKLFEVSAMQSLSHKEKQKYEDGLKYYRDMNNVIAFAREEGRLEAKAKSLKAKLEAKKSTLRNLLEKKLNIILPDTTHQKIEAAELDMLDCWIENIFDIKSIDDLLR